MLLKFDTMFSAATLVLLIWYWTPIDAFMSNEVSIDVCKLTLIFGVTL